MDFKRLNSVDRIRLRMLAIQELVRRRALSPVEGRALSQLIAEEWLKQHPTSKVQLEEKFKKVGLPTAEEIERIIAPEKHNPRHWRYTIDPSAASMLISKIMPATGHMVVLFSLCYLSQSSL